jgi:predicted nuclease of predicted toxin-antitoxin system
VRLLADENIHRIVVSRLREAGFEVEWIRQSSPGALDHEILARPDIASLVLITHDRDFGNLIFNKRLPAPYAILYSRLPHRRADTTADRTLALLEAGVIAGQMITMTHDGDRIKPYPAGVFDG